MRSVFLILALMGTLAAQQKIPAGSTIFIEAMDQDLDGYIKAELVKKKVRVRIVIDPEQAQYVMVGSTTPEEKRKWHQGWLTAEQDRTSGNVTVVEKASKTVVWAGEAGDRSLWWGSMARGGHRKVADRIVKNFKKTVSK